MKMTRVSVLRSLRGYTLADVERRTGKCYANLSMWESGARKAPEEIRSLLSGLYEAPEGVLWDAEGRARELPIEAVLQA
jgi:transcriptional regulator with XRE-family HTH domain